MQNFIQPGKAIDVLVTASFTHASGDLVAIGSLIGVAATAGAPGATISIWTEGVFELPKAAGAIDVGDPVYYDASTGGVASSGSLLVGVAVAGAEVLDKTVRVKLGVVPTAGA